MKGTFKNSALSLRATNGSEAISLSLLRRAANRNDMRVDCRSALKSIIRVMMILLCGIFFTSCRDHPYYIGPEHLLLDVEMGPKVVKQTVTGLVQCKTCPPNATTMLIDVYMPQHDTTKSLATVGFEQLGGYTITATVPYGELLEIRATIFTTGGILKTTAQVHATDDESLKEASTSVDLHVP